MTQSENVTLDQRPDGIRLLTLNRPQALNAITMAMAEQLSGFLEDITRDAEARCIILTGAGDRAFSAGFDIREMADFAPDQMRDALIARDPLMLAIATHPIPVIAAVNGLAHGAGALLAAACDFRVAGPGARFKVTAISYGSANATWSLPRLVGAARAKHILMTGREVGGEEGLAIGLFDSLTPYDALDGALALAKDIARQASAGVRSVKSLVDKSLGMPIKEAWQAEHDAMLATFKDLPTAGKDVFSSFLGKKM